MSLSTVATATASPVAFVSTAAASAADAAVVFDVPAAALPTGTALLPLRLRKKFLLLMPRAVTGWFCKKEVSAVLLFCFSPVF